MLQTRIPQAFTSSAQTALQLTNIVKRLPLPFRAATLACALSLSLSHSLSRARSHVRLLGCDAASCSCRCWPCAALARLFLARTFPVPPSPSRFSFAPISLSFRQALVAPRHQAAPLPLGCSLLLVQHHIHHYCTCHTFAINQSINHLVEGF